MKKITVSLALLAAVLVVACNKNAKIADTKPDTEVYLDLSDTSGQYFTNGFSAVNYPEVIDRKAVLGRVLFYDGHLSLNNAVSCGSCHKQQNAFADNARFSMGFEGRLAGRNTPPIQNLLGGRTITNMLKGDKLRPTTQAMFWDGRQNSVVELVLKPVSNHVEMGIADLSTLPAKLNELPYYKGLVQDAYGQDELDLDIISESIAFFMMSIRSDSTRFDMHEDNKVAFTAQEELGEHLFNTKYNCASCHNPFTQYYGSHAANNIGLDVVYKDKGMGAIQSNAGMDGVFRTPNLRNVALTAPYMHDGRFNTLDSVLEHYSRGIKDHPNLDTRLRDDKGKPMKMDISPEERKAIIAFLHTLTDTRTITNPKYSNPFRTK